MAPVPAEARFFRIVGDRFDEACSLPEALPESGYLWVAYTRKAFEANLAEVQAALQRWAGAQLFEPHVADLLNRQLPSNYDYTSAYDLLVFRRLAAGAASAAGATGAVVAADAAVAAGSPGEATGTHPPEQMLSAEEANQAIELIDNSPVGFVVFDRVLLTVHPTDCLVREFFANRLKNQIGGAESRAGTRIPSSPADLMLRMVNHMVDTYLELRRLLSGQLEHLHNELFNPRSAVNWRFMLRSRNSMHLLEDTCEDQRAAVVEWIDALDEWPTEADPARARDRELLRVRSRDVLEHIERVLTHVRRLQSSAESAVQMHFSAQSNRTNTIMRTLTVLTAIFLPLNLVTGFFGMNFEGLPLIHSATGFWVVFGLLLMIGIGLSVFFWRKRYLEAR